MRKLMWFTIGFAMTVGLSAYLLPVNWLVGIALLLLLPMLICLFFHKAVSKVIAVVLIGSITGLLYYTGFYFLFLKPVEAYGGTEQMITLEATDYAYNTDYGYAVDGKVTLNSKSYSVKLYYGDDVRARPGDLLQGQVSLRYTGAQDATYHKGEGIFLLANADGSMKFTQADSVPAKYFPAKLRDSISQRISEIFPEDTSGFAKALLLGDDHDIDYGEDMSYRKSGIRHVIAVSGLHVSILFSMVFFVSNRSYLLSLLLGLPVLFLFSAVAGFSPSVVRACIMQVLMILAMVVNREYDPGTSLAFSALVILCINPLTITSVSFQLSAGSMIGIFLFSQRISSYILSRKPLKKYDSKTRKGRFVRFIVQSVGVSLGALIVTLPLCAFYFGMVSVISVVTNLATLWLVSFVFCGIIASCALSLLWLPAGNILAYVVSWPIRYIQTVSRLLSGIPGGVAYTDSPYTAIWIGASAILILLFMLCKRKSPMLLSLSLIGFYMLSLFLTWYEPYSDRVRLTVLDVGQGQCILLQSKDSAYLLDCGGENGEYVADAAICALGAQGINQLDGIILTHYDKDHANGTPYLLQTIPVKQLYLPDTEKENSMRMMIEEQGVPITWVSDVQKLSCGVGELTVFPAEIKEDGNESSMCILYQTEKCAILVTGDRDLQGETYLLEQGNIPQLDVLVVGHHGSYNATGWELLNRTNPRIAIVSVGEQNPHGHPNKLTLERLYRFGCIVRRTDQEGTIIIRG